MKYSGFVFVLLLTCSAYSQVNVRDSLVASPMMTASFGYHIPSGDLKNRFGNSNTLGSSLWFKRKSNWIFGVNAMYIFGQSVKNKDSILKNISNNKGDIIDGNGQIAEVFFYERGFHCSAELGKIIPAFGPNRNSGIMILTGVGLLQHKIRIENPENVAPQIVGDYKKGYDKLSNGLALNHFIGYVFFDNHRIINFYAGIEAIEAWTANRRSFDFVMMRKDDKKRFDMLTGIKVGWVIPFYRRSTSTYYFY